MTRERHKTKVLALGVDSLAPALLREFAADLPNLSQLAQAGPPVKLTSVIPPDTIPAWVSIYTSRNPAWHGLLSSEDVFRSTWDVIRDYDVSIFRNRTFWDLASDAGKKVCVLFPILAFPPWPVNGVMVTRSLDKEIASYPSSVVEQYGIAHLRGISGRHPGVPNLGDYAENARRLIQQEAEFAWRISQDRDWDLFFVFFSWLDIVQHFFWRYHDENDPTHPTDNPFKNVIRDFYCLLDGIVGEFRRLHPDAALLVFSDHGHAMRPPRTVNINEHLRKHGLLAARGGRRNPAPFLIENAKRRLLDFAHRHELDHWLVRLATLRPWRALSLRTYTSASNIDPERTVAYLSSFAGPKSYSHGGIEINRENLGGRDYVELRSGLIRLLEELREPGSGVSLVEWARPREEVYSGPRLSVYPDILFKLKDGYGVYWGIHTPLIGTAYEHNLASGGHHPAAVFLLSQWEGRQPRRDGLTLMDIAPTLLDLLGVPPAPDFEGRSLFQE